MVVDGDMLSFREAPMKVLEFVGSNTKLRWSSISVVSSVGLIIPLVSLEMSWSSMPKVKKVVFELTH